MNLFTGRRLVIATQHGKEEVLAPLLERHLKVNCFVPQHFDTDTLGTFTGEVPRSEGPLETLRKKCLLAMEHSKCDLGVASEGSFGPHPSIYFANADDELLIFIDKKNKIEIVARELSLNTNFNGRRIFKLDQLEEFAKEALFPSHALIIRGGIDNYEEIIKGIRDWNVLINHFERLIKTKETITVETDMRAMYNPTRMQVIEKAGEKLIERILSTCPNCDKPGFAVTELLEGLPCSWCKEPTRSIRAHVCECEHCKHKIIIDFPNDKKEEDPAFCDHCNP